MGHDINPGGAQSPRIKSGANDRTGFIEAPLIARPKGQPAI